MFLRRRLKRLEERLQTHLWASPDIVECEKCGYLIYKIDAITKSKIQTRIKSIIPISSYGGILEEEYIKTTYYCKLHVPKKKRKLKKD